MSEPVGIPLRRGQTRPGSDECVLRADRLTPARAAGRAVGRGWRGRPRGLDRPADNARDRPGTATEWVRRGLPTGAPRITFTFVFRDDSCIQG